MKRQGRVATMQVEKRDYYEVLGVQRGAESGDIKKAYRRLAMECHPDHHPGDHTAEERFKELAEAYQVLSDPEKRQLYDRFGHQGPRSAGFQGFGGVNQAVAGRTHVNAKAGAKRVVELRRDIHVAALAGAWRLNGYQGRHSLALHQLVLVKQLLVD